MFFFNEFYWSIVAHSNILRKKLEIKGEWSVTIFWWGNWTREVGLALIHDPTWEHLTQVIIQFCCFSFWWPVSDKKRKASFKESVSIEIHFFCTVGWHKALKFYSCKWRLSYPWPSMHQKTMWYSRKDTKPGVGTHISCHFISPGLCVLIYSIIG